MTTSYEEILLGTGGTLANYINALADDDFIAMYSDNFFKSILKFLLDTHLNRETLHLGTLATLRTTVLGETRNIEPNRDQSIREFYKKVRYPPGNLASTAIMIVRPEVKSLILELRVNRQDINRDLIPLLRSQLVTAELEGYFLDIGTQETPKKVRIIATQSDS